MRAGWAMASDTGARVLAALDKLLAERPEREGRDFSEATRCLTAYREEVLGRAGAAQGERLAAVNAAISVVMAGHFPLGEVPWEHIEKAREQLGNLIEA